MIKGVLFDFDGTLIDTMHAFKKLAGELLFEYYQIPKEKGEELYLETSGISFERQMEIIMPGGLKNEEIIKRFEKEKLKDVLNEKLEEDALETIYYLKNQNIKIGISSGNYPYIIEDFLKRQNVVIDVVMGHEKNFEKGKAHFDYFLAKTGLSKEEIVFVGDSIKDGERARDYGVFFIAREGIFKKERFQKEFGKDQLVINKISEIIDILKEKK